MEVQDRSDDQEAIVSGATTRRAGRIQLRRWARPTGFLPRSGAAIGSGLLQQSAESPDDSGVVGGDVVSFAGIIGEVAELRRRGFADLRVRARVDSGCSEGDFFGRRVRVRGLGDALMGAGWALPSGETGVWATSVLSGFRYRLMRSD